MFSLLFDSGFWYDLIFIAAAVFLMYLVIKYPQGRIYFFTFLSLAFIGVTIFCGVNLNTYLSAQGGIFGSLSGAFGLDKVEVVDNQTFELNNLWHFRERCANQPRRQPGKLHRVRVQLQFLRRQQSSALRRYTVYSSSNVCKLNFAARFNARRVRRLQVLE